MRVLKATEIEQLLSHAQCTEIIDAAMRRVSAGEVTLPLRQFMPIPGARGKLGVMPGYLAEPACFGVKLVSKYEREPGSPHGSHVGAVMIFDAGNGLPLALLEGGTLTAIRTAAASAVATRALARPESRVLLICGCGEQAHHHVAALMNVRSFTRVLIWGRSHERAVSFAHELGERIDVACEAAADLETAVANADVICTVTSAAQPYLRGEWLRAGQHLNLVGSAVAHTAEVDSEAVRRGRFFVDYRQAAENQAGELLAAIRAGLIDASHVAGEIGEVLLGRVPGRTDPADITIYKSLGVSAQDLAAGYHVLQAAEVRGAGTLVELDS